MPELANTELPEHLLHLRTPQSDGSARVTLETLNEQRPELTLEDIFSLCNHSWFSKSLVQPQRAMCDDQSGYFIQLEEIYRDKPATKIDRSNGTTNGRESVTYPKASLFLWKADEDPSIHDPKTGTYIILEPEMLLIQLFDEDAQPRSNKPQPQTEPDFKIQRVHKGNIIVPQLEARYPLVRFEELINPEENFFERFYTLD